MILTTNGFIPLVLNILIIERAGIVLCVVMQNSN